MSKYSIGNREIKFRAWDGINKKWLHRYTKLGGCSIFGETILLGGWLNGVSLENLNEISITQYTGLKDKNGKEIYEGDIVQTIVDTGMCNGSIHNEIFVVEYKKMSHYQINPGFYLGESLNDPSKEAEVIGNIFENPELINE